MRMRWMLPFCIAQALMAAGCRGPALWRYEERLQHTSGPAAHAVYDQRLAELMQGLERLRSERLPKALDMRAEEERRAREVARVANALAESAGDISAAVPATLDPADREAFLGLAASLERQARQLAAEVPQLGSEASRARLAEIDATCAECHRGAGIPGVANGAN
jgi:hypothetical protein